MITEEQRLERHKHLGSSDAAAVLGYDPWREPYDVWAEKTGKTLSHERRSNPAMNLGQALEPVVLDWAEGQLGPLKRDHQVPHKGGILFANVDALALTHSPPVIVEAKTSGIMTPLYRNAWGEDGTDEISAHIIIQVHHQMLCLSNRLGHVDLAMDARVPALLGGRGFVMYEVPRQESLLVSMDEQLHEWWAKHVVTDIPPEGTPNRTTIKRLIRMPGKVVDLDMEAVGHWMTCRDKAKEWKQLREMAEAKMLATFGDAEVGNCELGTVSYLEQKRNGYTVQPSTFRKISFKQRKKVEA